MLRFMVLSKRKVYSVQLLSSIKGRESVMTEQYKSRQRNDWQNRKQKEKKIKNRNVKRF